MAWIFFRPWRLAYSKANRAIRVEAFSVMIFRLSTTPGTTSCSRPEYKSSVFSRTQIGVEVEGLAQRDVHAGRTAGDGRGHGALQRNTVPAHGFHGCLVDGFSLVGRAVGASRDLFPIDLHPRGFQDAAGRSGNFRPNSFAGD